MGIVQYSNTLGDPALYDSVYLISSDSFIISYSAAPSLLLPFFSTTDVLTPPPPGSVRLPPSLWLVLAPRRGLPPDPPKSDTRRRGLLIRGKRFTQMPPQPCTSLKMGEVVSNIEHKGDRK